MSPRHLLLPLCAATLALSPAVAAEPVAVRATPVALNPSDPTQRVVGHLEYRGGLQLVSEHPRFGGISSIRVLPDGERLVGITDEGLWLSARPVLRKGLLEGIEDVEMGPLLDPGGKAPEGKDARDAESLALCRDGSFIVGFERRHRLLRYPAGRGRPDGVPTAVPSPPGLEASPLNGGIEALVSLPGGALFALTEYWLEGPDRRVDRGPGHWEAARAAVRGALRPADAALLPGGDVLILERASCRARDRARADPADRALVDPPGRTPRRPAGGGVRPALRPRQLRGHRRRA
jgi:hypothetical protein